MQETLVWSLGRVVPLDKEMATCSSILAWEIPWTEEHSGLQPVGHKELDRAKKLTDFKAKHSKTVNRVAAVLLYLFGYNSGNLKDALVVPRRVSHTYVF